MGTENDFLMQVKHIQLLRDALLTVLSHLCCASLLQTAAVWLPFVKQQDCFFSSKIVAVAVNRHAGAEL